MTEFSSRGHAFHEQVQHRREAFLVLPAFHSCCEHSKVRPEVCPDRFCGSGEIIPANGADDRAGPCSSTRSSTPHGPNAACDCRLRPGGRGQREETNRCRSHAGFRRNFMVAGCQLGGTMVASRVGNLRTPGPVAAKENLARLAIGVLATRHLFAHRIICIPQIKGCAI